MGCLKWIAGSTCWIALVLMSAQSVKAEETSPGLRPLSERFGDLQKAESPSFRRHVIPMMARVGCSSRECHGSFQGRGGFQLSLFGSDWDHDHVQITQTKGGADLIRVDMNDPEQSLILLKPTAQVDHKGKERIKKGSWEYNLMLKWLRDGAKNDADRTGELQDLEISPPEMVFNHQGETAQLRVLARWKDGTTEDVTQVTRFKTNDETVATVSDEGLISCAGKGDSHIVASYDNGVVPVPVMLPVSIGSKYPPVATRTRVDELVVDKLRKVGIVPSEVCTDSEFLRRVSLDLTGTLPTPDEVLRFTSDSSPNKRSAKIDELLKSPGYDAWWATRLCDYTGDSPRTVNLGGNINKNAGDVSRQWYQWLFKRVSENMPYDQIAAGIIMATSRSSPQQSYKDYTAEADSYFRADHPADYADHPTLAYFWQRRTVAQPTEKALAFTHTFLGVRLECAQCHKHPFDRWTKRDFEQFSAFFAPIVFNQGPKGKDAKDSQEVSYQSVSKDIKDKVTKEVEEKSPDTKDDPKKAQQLQQKATTSEIVRRIDAGEPVPWFELWVNSRGTPVKGKNNNADVSAATPKILGGPAVTLSDYEDSRKPLMDWLRDKSNPYFARALVNRVWASYFNRGIVDPPDDMNLANAPCNGELLNYLAQGFIEHGFDMQWLHREILNSDTYQRSWKTNATNQLDARNFSHAVVRQLPAEIMLDAIDMATASDNRLASFPTAIDDRAIGPGGVGSYSKGKVQKGSDGYFLTIFGRPVRETNCDCERTTDPTLLQTLYIRNDPNLLAKMESPTSWIAELRKAGAQFDTDHVITQAFLRTVSRTPTDQEMANAQHDIAAAKTSVDGVRDLLWALINTREFKVNH
jgi:hypothetical protein